MSPESSNNNNHCEMLADGCFFRNKPCLELHMFLLATKPGDYLAALQTICDTGVVTNLSQPTKARVLAALHITGNTKHVDNFLKHCDVVEVTKAAQILDRPRLVKQLERRIAKIEQECPHIKEEREKSEQEEERRASRTKRQGRKTRREAGSKHVCEQESKKRKRQVDVYRTELKNQMILMNEVHGPELACDIVHTSSVVKEMISSASLSGAFARKVRRWAKDLKPDFLEFILMSGSFEYWKRLADLVHFSPSDFSLPFFLAAVHGGQLPEGSFVHGMKHLINVSPSDVLEAFMELAKYHPKQLYQAFNFLRTQPRLLRNREIACLLARNIPLSTAVWYLEELAQVASKDVSRIVSERLKTESWMDQSSKVMDSFGKLLERILTFQSQGWENVANELMPAAERRLVVLKEAWSLEEQEEGLTVIFGDKSYSMTSAIRASTILAAMVSACFRGELCFFDHQHRVSPHAKPESVKQVLKICQQVRASGGTSLASALWPYYNRKISIQRIILVTDEEENTPYQELMFAKMLALYKKEVYENVELVIICVDKGDDEFRRSLERNNIDCKRIEIDGTRPDLSKFDAMLSQIALLSRKTRQEPETLAAGESKNATQETKEIEGVEDVEDDFVVLDEDIDY